MRTMRSKMVRTIYREKSLHCIANFTTIPPKIDYPTQPWHWLGSLGGGTRVSHLHPALVRGVDLEVVPVGGVQPQQAQALGASVLAWKERKTRALIRRRRKKEEF